jgi:F0F1-type ATP synthase assembly protein I
MKKPTTPLQTPSPDARNSLTEVEVGRGTNPRTEFLSATLNMSWQLAIVVLVPIIGGFELDKKLHMLPLLTIVGFILAMIGMGVVVWRQLQIVSPLPTASRKGPRP